MDQGHHSWAPATLDLAVHLVNFFGWMNQGGHSEPLLLLALFYQSTPSCLKVRGWVVVAHIILVSAQVLLVLTLDLGLTIYKYLIIYALIALLCFVSNDVLCSTM